MRKRKRTRKRAVASVIVATAVVLTVNVLAAIMAGVVLRVATMHKNQANTCIVSAVSTPTNTGKVWHKGISSHSGTGWKHAMKRPRLLHLLRATPIAYKTIGMTIDDEDWNSPLHDLP